MPPDLDVTGLVQDLADYTALESFFADYQATGELLDDTLKVLASDVTARIERPVRSGQSLPANAQSVPTNAQTIPANAR